MNQHRWGRRCFICVLCFGLVLSYSAYLGREARGDERPTNPDIGPNTFESLSYQASDYRFQIISLDEVPPQLEDATTLPPELNDFLIQLRDALPPELKDFLTQLHFDDTDFPTGSAAFGSGGVCSLEDTVLADWPVKSQLLVRRVVDIPVGVTGVRG